MAKLLSALAAVALASAAASAHHSFAAEYNANDQVTLVGTITKVEWTNAPTVLYREGWKPNSLKAGDEVTVTIALGKDKSKKQGNAYQVKLPDGRCVF